MKEAVANLESIRKIFPNNTQGIVRNSGGCMQLPKGIAGKE